MVPAVLRLVCEVQSMREIKFRGFRTVQKDWVYGNLIVDENGTKYIVENNLFSADGHHLVYDPTDEPAFIDQKTVSQYTGMKDFNGKEIYEGDIVEIHEGDIAKIACEGFEKKYVVVFDDSELDFKATNGTEEYGSEFEYLQCCDKVDVIGNRWDNPELLGGAHDEQE